MKIKGIKHIFFDLDHTLWDFEKNSGLTFQYILEKHAVRIPIERFLNVYTPINFDYWRRFRNNEVSKQELRYGRLKDTFDMLKLTVDNQTIDHLSNAYLHHLSDHNFLFEGAIELLEYLKPNYSLHIITNGFEEVQHRKLKNSNLNNFFETIVTSDVVGVKKPDPKIFEYALQHAQAEPQQSLMIGDNYEADILGAKNVGLNSIYFNTSITENLGNQFMVNTLSSIQSYL